MKELLLSSLNSDQEIFTFTDRTCHYDLLKFHLKVAYLIIVTLLHSLRVNFVRIKIHQKKCEVKNPFLNIFFAIFSNIIQMHIQKSSVVSNRNNNTKLSSREFMSDYISPLPLEAQNIRSNL